MSSLWPLPSTPAMPTISPARTSKVTPRTASSPRSSRTCRSSTRRSVSPGCDGGPLSTRSSTSRPTMSVARLSSVAPSRGTVSIVLPRRRTVIAVGDVEHLVELVGDEDDRLALGLERAQDREQLVRLLRRQHGRGLVEDEDVGAAVERLQDLHALLLADRDRLDLRVGLHGEAEALRDVAHPLARLVHVHERASVRLDAEDDVLRHRHHGDEHEVLVHHPDPEVDRLVRGADPLRLPAHADLALVGVVEPVEDVHQRRLAGAVLAEERVHLAGAELEVDRVVGDDAREPLRDALQLEKRRVCHVGGSVTGRATPPAPSIRSVLLDRVRDRRCPRR